MAGSSLSVTERNTVQGARRYSDAELMAALKKNAGLIALAARELECDRSTVAHRVARSPELQAFIAEIDAEVMDVAEGHIITAIKKGDMKTVRWYADRKMKGRGFGRTDDAAGITVLNTEGSGPVQINVTYVTPAIVEDVL